MERGNSLPLLDLMKDNISEELCHSFVQPERTESFLCWAYDYRFCCIIWNHKEFTVLIAHILILPSFPQL